MTRRAEMKPVLHTDERFHRHQTGVLQTSPRPACAALSPALCFYLRLIRADRSANIDHGVLGKILPPGLRGDYRPWTQLMQTGCVYVCTFRFFPTPPVRQAIYPALYSLVRVSPIICRRETSLKKKTPRQTGRQAGRRAGRQAHCTTQKIGYKARRIMHVNPNHRNSNDLDASPTSPPLLVCLLSRPQNSPIGSEGNKLQIQRVCIRNGPLLIKLVGKRFFDSGSRGGERCGSWR